MMGGGSILLIVTRTIATISGTIVSGLIFGYHFSYETTLPIIIWTSLTIMGGVFLTSYLFLSTRKKLKEQRAKLDKELEDAAAYV